MKKISHDAEKHETLTLKNYGAPCSEMEEISESRTVPKKREQHWLLAEGCPVASG